MLFYNCRIKFSLQQAGEASSEAQRVWKTQLADLSATLSEGIDGERVRVLIHRARKSWVRIILEVLIAVDGFKELTAARLSKLMEKFFAEHDEFGVDGIETLFGLTEITLVQFSRIFERANTSDKFNFDFYHLNQELGLDVLNNRTFRIMETISPRKRLSYATAILEAEKLLADETFKAEFARIYAKENARKFYGQPVHYKIVAAKTDAALTLSNLLVGALYANKRLISRRVTAIININENCYDETDFEKILEHAAGGTVVIDLSGERVKSGQFAHVYEEVVEFISQAVLQYQRNTLFIFVELTEKPGFAPQLIAKLQDDLHIIELQEGAGNRDTALSYLKALMTNSDMTKVEYSDEELLKAMGDKLTFTASDIYVIRDKLFNNALKEKTYPAYREVDRVTVADEKISNDAYADFREMIGLTEQKALIEQIIAAHKVQKMRLDMNLDRQKAALHMSFTGNPGTAKTTVARLLSQILARDGVLKTGNFVECGRADLVAKYVGWTAKAVREKFRQARGGVLFIDEAYSLSDGEHATFGDEALNTIVQEMENNRDNVIVIFAGYPDKMKDFLDRNEGLRSRIAFHVNFPDYNVDELTEIFKLMAKRRGFEVSDEVAAHCRGIFKHIAKQKNFGNGRFVRNLLEQAWLKQAQRLVNSHKDSEVTRKELTNFAVEDFDLNLEKTYTETRQLGFVR